MKVLQIGSNSIHVSSFVKNIANTLPQQYLLAEEICNFEGIEEEFHVDFRNMNPFSILKNYRKTKKIIRELTPDIIHIHQINRLAYFVGRIASSLKIKVIATAWGGDVLLMPQKNSFYRFLVKKTLERSKVVTADSEDMILAMKGIHADDKEKYVHLQYGIDPIQSAEKEKIIYSNRLHKPLYRIDLIIDLFRDFQKNHSDWKLVIGATGVETENLKRMVDSYKLTDSVEFVGWLEKKDNEYWYSAAHIFVSLPISDGTSVSLLEAMSAECIPVVTDLDVSREWIENGENGVLFSGSTNPFEEALKLDKKTACLQNKEKVIKIASRSATSKVFLDLYNNIVDAK